MVVTFAYSTATNTITASGAGTTGLTNFYSADKAGTLLIQTARNIVGPDGAPVAVTRALRPTDLYVLGGAELYITITNYTANGTINIVGTDANGGAINENIAFVGNGQYNTVLFYRTVTSTQVTVFGGNFTYTLTQGQWGVVSKQQCTTTASHDQYALACKLIIGDTVNATSLVDTNKQIIWTNFVHWGGTVLVYITNASSVTFGTLVAGHDTKDGCALNSSSYGNKVFDLVAGAALNLYGCQLWCTQGIIDCHSSTATVTAYNCLFDQIGFINNSNIDLYNTNFQHSTFYSIQNCIGAFNLINISATGGQVFWVYAANPFTVSNTTIIGVVGAPPYLMRISSITVDKYLVDVISDAWTFNWIGGAANTHVIYRQYTFNLHIVDAVGANVAGATVTLKNDAGANVFSVATAADGTIAEQNVSRGYYDQANGNVLQDYGPFDLFITMANYMPYTHNDIVLDEPVDWRIYLRDQLTGNALIGEVITGRTFYKDDADSKLTGTLALIGTANVGNVMTGLTFYKDNPQAILTGTLALTGDANVTDVMSPRTFYKDDPLTQLTGTVTEAQLLAKYGGGGGMRTKTVEVEIPPIELIQGLRDYFQRRVQPKPEQ